MFPAQSLSDLRVSPNDRAKERIERLEHQARSMAALTSRLVDDSVASPPVLGRDCGALALRKSGATYRVIRGLGLFRWPRQVAIGNPTKMA
jgi:hypothetical protein